MANAARLAALALSVLALMAPSASAQSSGLHITLIPAHVVQGTSARIAVNVKPTGVSCGLHVRYTGGGTQSGLPKVVAKYGYASWNWNVPIDVQAGAATVGISCGRAGSVSRKILVVGRLVAPKIDVIKTGFTTRTSANGQTRLSYGVLLHNDSSATDATQVSVQTNFVLGDDHLLGTDTQRVSGLSADADYAVGNTITFPGLAPVVRLEVVVQVTHFAPHAMHFPTLANIHLVPGSFDPAWLGSVEGEIQNTDPVMTLQSATLTTIVFDSNGNIIGGATGFAYQPLAPGVRSFIKIANGLDVIPMVNAASVSVYAVPTWAPPA
jgi:hypothetical protein